MAKFPLSTPRRDQLHLDNGICIKDFVQQLVVHKWKVVMHEDKIIQPLLFQVVSLLHVNAFNDKQIMLTLYNTANLTNCIF